VNSDVTDGLPRGARRLGEAGGAQQPKAASTERCGAPNRASPVGDGARRLDRPRAGRGPRGWEDCVRRTPADLVAAKKTLTGEHLAAFVGSGAKAVATRSTRPKAAGFSLSLIEQRFELPSARVDVANHSAVAALALCGVLRGDDRHTVGTGGVFPAEPTNLARIQRDQPVAVAAFTTLGAVTQNAIGVGHAPRVLRVANVLHETLSGAAHSPEVLPCRLELVEGRARCTSDRRAGISIVTRLCPPHVDGDQGIPAHRLTARAAAPIRQRAVRIGVAQVDVWPGIRARLETAAQREGVRAVEAGARGVAAAGSGRWIEVDPAAHTAAFAAPRLGEAVGTAGITGSRSARGTRAARPRSAARPTGAARSAAGAAPGAP
jgi:hypothetical protein